MGKISALPAQTQQIARADVWVLDQEVASVLGTYQSTVAALHDSATLLTSRTMSGTVTLTSAATFFQYSDPNGANRNLDHDSSTQTTGRTFRHVHTGSANTITLRNAAAGTIVVLSKGQAATITWNGSAWVSHTTTSASGALIDTPTLASPTFTGTATGPLAVSGDITAQTGSDFVKLFGSQGKIHMFYSGVESVVLVPSANSLNVDKGIACTVNSNAFLSLAPVTPASQTAFVSLYRGGFADWQLIHLTSGNVFEINKDGTRRIAFDGTLTASSLVFVDSNKVATTTVQAGCLTSANLRTMLTDDNGIAGAAIFSDARAVTGSKISGAALADLLTKLAELGIITDSTSA